jgi:TonB family protein
VNEAVDRLIAERARLDRGFPATALASILGHLVLMAAAVAVPRLLPREPPLRVAEFAVAVLPRGGGGSPAAQAPPAAAPAPRPQPVASAAPPPPPKVLKPPTDAPRPRALPLPDSRRTARAKPELPLPASRTRESATSRSAPASAAGASGAQGTALATPGLEFGPPGPGVPDGTDSGGDWYLAGVQQKIWMLWNQQIKAGFAQPIGVTFTIQPNGTVTDVRVTQPSGAALLDMAAQRAVLNAAPFGPLPREYGQNPRTIQALFRPTS